MENLEALKAKHGTLYTVTVPVGDENKECTVYLKKMDRIVYSATLKLLESDPLDATEFLLKSLWVGGENVNIILEDFDALRSASNLMVEIIKSKEGSIKKN
jgi:hypothetical protein